MIGSLTKAGKVRQQTPKIEPIPKKRLPPRIKNRRKFKNRILLERESGQVWINLKRIYT